MSQIEIYLINRVNFINHVIKIVLKLSVNPMKNFSKVQAELAGPSGIRFSARPEQRQQQSTTAAEDEKEGNELVK